MISVLIGTKYCRQELYPRDEFRGAWKQATDILRRYRTSSGLVEIPFRFLDHVGRRYFDSPKDSEPAASLTEDHGQNRANPLGSSSAIEPGPEVYGSNAQVENGPTAGAAQPEVALDAILASVLWEPPWASKMDDKMLELFADPQEGWDLQWLDDLDVCMPSST